MKKKYFFNILVGFDQLINTLVGGWPDETLSSSAHRAYTRHKPWGWTRNLINAMFWWQDDHCKEAYFYEKNRRQLPPELRE